MNLNFTTPYSAYLPSPVSCVALMTAIIILAIAEAGDLIRNLALGGRIAKILQYNVIILHNGL